MASLIVTCLEFSEMGCAAMVPPDILVSLSNHAKGMKVWTSGLNQSVNATLLEARHGWEWCLGAHAAIRGLINFPSLGQAWSNLV